MILRNEPNISLCHTRYWLHDTDHKFTSSAENPQEFNVDFVTPFPHFRPRKLNQDESMNAIYVKWMSPFFWVFGLDVHFILQKLYILRQWGALICNFISFLASEHEKRLANLKWPSPIIILWPFHQETKGNNDNLKLRDCTTGCIRDRNSWEAKGTSQYHPPTQKIRPSQGLIRG